MSADLKAFAAATNNAKVPKEWQARFDVYVNDMKELDALSVEYKSLLSPSISKLDDLEIYTNKKFEVKGKIVAKLDKLMGDSEVDLFLQTTKDASLNEVDKLARQLVNAVCDQVQRSRIYSSANNSPASSALVFEKLSEDKWRDRSSVDKVSLVPEQKVAPLSAERKAISDKLEQAYAQASERWAACRDKESERYDALSAVCEYAKATKSNVITGKDASFLDEDLKLITNFMAFDQALENLLKNVAKLDAPAKLSGTVADPNYLRTQVDELYSTLYKHDRRAGTLTLHSSDSGLKPAEALLDGYLKQMYQVAFKKFCSEKEVLVSPMLPSRGLFDNAKLESSTGMQNLRKYLDEVKKLPEFQKIDSAKLEADVISDQRKSFFKMTKD